MKCVDKRGILCYDMFEFGTNVSVTRPKMISRRTVQDVNSLRILGILRLRPGTSRTEIAKQTHLGKATVSVLVQGLIKDRLVCEEGAGIQLASAGRRPVGLRLNSRTRFSIGLELTGNECISALTDLYANPLRVLRKPMRDLAVPAVVGCIADSVRELLHGFEADALLGIGVGVPGPVDAARQCVIKAENIGWTDVPLGSILEERLDAPVTVVKRQNAGALGEYWYGIGRSKANLLYISVAVGIGCGIIVQGKLYEGANGSAGEIGHTTVIPDGDRCRCGNIGCLETVSSLPAIGTRAMERVRRGRASLLSDLACGVLESISGDMVLEAATKCDPLAIETVQEAARYLGIAVANVINLFNPAMVILGGAVLDAGDLFLDPIREEIQRRAFSIPLAAVEVVPSALGFRAAAIGAATLVTDSFFSPPRSTVGGC
jgi:glucokinase-like ROK family protein